MLDITRLSAERLATTPYRWGLVKGLLQPEDAESLASSFPVDHFKRVAGYDGEKSYEYRARALIHMGADGPAHLPSLSTPWQQLAWDLCSPEYRHALMRITGVELESALLEVNVTEYGPGAFLGPHVDLSEKLVTHVMYFTQGWRPDQGGSLAILRSHDPADVECEIAPIPGNSAILVRSQHSWHRVSAISSGTRRAINVIFHSPGATSTMWPAEPRQPSYARRLFRHFKRRPMRSA